MVYDLYTTSRHYKFVSYSWIQKIKEHIRMVLMNPSLYGIQGV